MGCVRRDPGVSPRGVDAFVCDRRIVVEMDQIMRHARMQRLPQAIGSRMAAPLSWLE